MQKEMLQEFASEFAAGMALCHNQTEENVMLRQIDSFCSVVGKFEKGFDSKAFRALICSHMDCPVARHNVVMGL